MITSFWSKLTSLSQPSCAPRDASFSFKDWMTSLANTYALCELLDGESRQLEHRSSQKGVDHHAHTMSRNLSSNSGHQSSSTFRIVLRQVQLLLQLRIDRFADQA